MGVIKLSFLLQEAMLTKPRLFTRRPVVDDYLADVNCTIRELSAGDFLHQEGDGAGSKQLFERMDNGFWQDVKPSAVQKEATSSSCPLFPDNQILTNGDVTKLTLSTLHVFTSKPFKDESSKTEPTQLLYTTP
jgi:hypothetical protein